MNDIEEKISFVFNVDIVNTTVTISKVVNDEIVDNFWFDQDDDGNRFIHNDEAYTFAENKIKKLLIAENSESEPIVLSKYEFLLLFSDEELQTLYTLAKTDIQIEVAMSLFNAAEEIDMNNERIISAFNQFENNGLLSSDRIEEIRQRAIDIVVNRS